MLLQFREFFRFMVANLLGPLSVILVAISLYSAYKIIFIKREFTWVNNVKLAFASLVLFSFVLLGYGYLIERNSIEVTDHSIMSKTIKSSKKFAVIADLHLGIWQDQEYLDKVVDKINTIPNLDYLLIPGDWTYHPEVPKLTEIFAPLKKIKIPIYGVLGNHDVEKPGEPYRQELLKALTQNNVKVTDEKLLTFDDFSLAGLGDRWGGEDDSRFLTSSKSDLPLIVIAHNPDSVRSYPFEMNSDREILTISGHTHCGQIRIPYLYKFALPVQDSYFDKGWYRTNFNNKIATNFDSNNAEMYNSLFITCGTGEVGIPVRLFNPPMIDVITVTQK